MTSTSLRRAIKAGPLGPLARWLYVRVAGLGFRGSEDYWQQRYRKGGASGPGSVGRLARFKADVLHGLVERHALSSVVEFGCGDGSQLALTEYPRYLGLDISPVAIERCRSRFQHDATKSFALLGSVEPGRHDAALSLDVIYHLVEDEVFEAYMAQLFDAARRLVVIYSSNGNSAPAAPHVRHRRFTDWVEAHRPDWVLKEVIPNRYPYDAANDDETSFADFYVFAKS